MYLTQTNLIRGLSKREYLMLRMMCFFSKNLYNVTLYNIRQHYFKSKRKPSGDRVEVTAASPSGNTPVNSPLRECRHITKDNAFLSYFSNYHECKENENYKLLQAQVAQQTMKVVDRAFHSFFALIEKARRGEYRFQDIKLPKYRAKGSLFNLSIPSQSVIIHDGFLSVPMSNAFASIYGREKIKIKLPEHIPVNKIKEIRIIPILNGNKFKIQYVYKVESEQLNLNQNETLAIDVGLENLATCISTVGTSFIMNGRGIKSINRLWNKRRAELQSRLPKVQYTSNLIRRLTLKRNNR